jgi:phosphoribosylformylglycinamidine (FGAM) synthase-like amidotransferase family enzyme
LFKFRVDALPIVETGGIAISDRLIQVVTEKTLVKSIRDGKETAVRVADKRGTTSTHVFNTNGSRKAFADLSRECPLD